MKQINEHVIRKIWLKHDPEWSLGIPWGSPGWSLDGLWGAAAASGERSRPFLAKSQTSQTTMKCTGSTNVSILGLGRDQKSTKNRSLAQKVVPASNGPLNFRASIFFLNFGLDASSILNSKSMEKIDAFFQSLACFFKSGGSVNPCTGAVFWVPFTFFVSEACGK